MNDDLISRIALKKAFEKVYPLCTNEMGGVVNKGIYDIIDNAPTVEFPEHITIKCDTEEDKQKLLSALRTAKLKVLVEEDIPQGEWIPVSERLPEQAHKTYLVTVDFGGGQLRSCEMYFYGGDIGWNYGGITAWMPLSEPYKENNYEKD